MPRTKTAPPRKKTAGSKGSNGKSKRTTDFFKQLGKDELRKALRTMMLARAIDIKALRLLAQGKTFFHIAGSGHEAIQVALGQQMDPKVDWFFPYYRDMCLSLSLGISAQDFFYQCFAKEEDPACGGRQLPGHWGANDKNIPAQSSPTGTQYLQAVGTALASRKLGVNSVSYVSSGEGTTSQGEFYEAINWASREKLPVIFVIQNNKYAISVHVSKQVGARGNSIAEMAKGYENLKSVRIDGTDFQKSWTAAHDAIEYARSGKGPVLIEAEVVRLQSHSSSDDQKKYRPADELKSDLENDPIEKLKDILFKKKLFTKKEVEELQEEITAEINEAIDNAQQGTNPDPLTAEKYTFDESDLMETLEYETKEPDGERIVMVDAINHALREEMEANDKIYVFGEDIADDKGGVFTATKGLSTKFGDERVFNSPLAEASIMGVAAGMALAGLKPAVEIQFGDYIWPGFHQIKNEIATYRYRSNNAWSTSVVTRVAVGGYIHGGLYHSQNIESIFAHIPGLYIAFPSNAADAKGLLKTSLRIDDPVMFLEHKGLYRQSFAITPEPDEEYLVPFGKAKVVQEGTDITVVTYGLSVWDSFFAAKKLAVDEYSVEIIDIRTIIPLDEETIIKSVKKTNKVIVIHEDTLTGGFGAEIAARISEKCFEHLDGPVRRLAAKDTHIPYAPILENTVLPSRDETYKAIKSLLEY